MKKRTDAFPQGPGAAASVLLVLLSLLCFLSGIGSRDLWNPDEPRYAQVAAEMSAEGSWFLPRLNGRLYTHKPPLHFWDIALVGALRGGVDEVAARLPSVLAVTLTGLLVLHLSTWWFGRRVGWAAAAVFLGGNAIQWRGRIGQIDMTLTALVVAAVTCFIVGRMREDDRWFTGFYAFSGLAILAKGPAGFLPAWISVLVFLAVERDWGTMRRFLRLRGPLVLLAICLLWLVPAVITAGPSYLRALLVEQTVDRFLDPPGHIQPFAYLWVIAPTDLLPFSLFLPAALGALIVTGSLSGKEGNAPWLRFLCWWSFATVLFFSLSAGKRSVYINAVLVPLSMLVAAGLERIDLWRRGSGRSLRLWHRLALAAQVVIAGLFAFLAVLLPTRYAHQPEIQRFGSALPWAIGLLAMAALGSVVVLVAIRRWRWTQALVALGLVFGALGALAARQVLPALDEVKSARALSQVVREEVPAGVRICIHPDPDAAFLFYSGRLLEPAPTSDSVIECLSEEGERWLLVERDELRSLRLPRPMIEIGRDGDWQQGHVLLRSDGSLSMPSEQGDLLSGAAEGSGG